MAAANAALFVFAHQDDEMAAASRIAFELARGSRVHCVFLTDGGAGKASPAVRDRESLSALSHLGVATEHIFFLGSELPIKDGTLVDHLDLALERLEGVLQRIEINTIYCLAWEGGHQDHDASQLVAAAFGRRRGLLDRCFELPLYHGSGTPLFRVLSPLRRGEKWESRRLTFRQGLRLVSLVRWFPSQRKSWLGLLPEAFLKLVILRRERFWKVNSARFRERPHRGALFYERWFRFPYERFASAAASFVDAHFPR